MHVLPISYPSTPEGVDEDVLKPSSQFKQEVLRVLAAIVFFILTYLVLVAAAIGFSLLCAAAGFLLVVNVPKFLTLMIGIGLVGLGAMVIFFLFKFLFKRNKTDRSHLIEIKEGDQPELFAFIRTLTQETQSQFPKKIYLSHEVNASVFYDSGFWSMFLPIRKNLQIGLGLVNSVNLSEFKAVLAHEFGHFSQRSMKLGSYVYNVNHIIYNMLYDNEGYGRTLESWANISGYFAFFANITVKIVAGIQWVLQKVYAVVNKSYMALSRQMEFHADAVSAYVSGSAHLATSLRRLEISDTAYTNLFQYYDQLRSKNLIPDNIYPQHVAIMHQIAKDHGIVIKDGLPQVNGNSFAASNKSRLVIKDQWASHPTIEDREKHLQKLNIRSETVRSSAWTIFREPESLQKKMTEKLFAEAQFEQAPKRLDLASFQELYKGDVEKYQLNNRYKGFFNFRNISVANLKTLDGPPSETEFDEILNESTLSLPYEIEGLKSDLQNIGFIRDKAIPVKEFEFAGNRYKRSHSPDLIRDLEDQLLKAEHKLVACDHKMISFFIHAASKHGQGERIRQRYNELFLATESAEEDLKKHAQMMQDISPIFYSSLPLTEVQIVIAKVKNNEIEIKERLSHIISSPGYHPYITEADLNTLNQYVSTNQEYFRDPTFNNEALELLIQAMNIYQAVVSDRSFFMKKDLLEWQLCFLDRSDK
jgi:Zn-dependent protease with chaperone function